MNASSPITPLRLLTDRNRSSANITRALLVAGMFGMFFFLTSSSRTSWATAHSRLVSPSCRLPPFFFAASQISSRLLVHRLAPSCRWVVALALSALGLLVLTRLSEGTSYLWILLSLTLGGIGNGVAFVPLTSTRVARVAPAMPGRRPGWSTSCSSWEALSRRGSGDDLRFGQPLTPHVIPGASAARMPQHAFVYGADLAFFVAGLFLSGDRPGDRAIRAPREHVAPRLT